MNKLTLYIDDLISDINNRRNSIDQYESMISDFNIASNNFIKGIKEVLYIYEEVEIVNDSIVSEIDEIICNMEEPKESEVA